MIDIRDSMRVRGRVEVKLTDEHGNVKLHEITENGVTDIGLENIVDHLVSGGGAALTHLGIGWGTGANTAFAAGQTDLQGASTDRKAASVSKIDGKNWKLEATWGANDPSPSATVGIEEIGTFWGATGANMYSRSVRAIINKAPSDTLQITYYLDIDEA